MTASTGSRSSTGGSIAPAIPLAASIDDPQRPDRLDVDEREHLLDEARPDVLRLHLAAPLGRAEAAQRPVAHVEQARVAADRQRAAADDLHARVLLRVVRGGDADAAVEPELADREVEHLRADQPDVEHVRAAVGGALDQRPPPSPATETRMSRPTAIARGSNCST